MGGRDPSGGTEGTQPRPARSCSSGRRCRQISSRGGVGNRTLDAHESWLRCLALQHSDYRHPARTSSRQTCRSDAGSEVSHLPLKQVESRRPAPGVFHLDGHGSSVECARSRRLSCSPARDAFPLDRMTDLEYLDIILAWAFGRTAHGPAATSADLKAKSGHLRSSGSSLKAPVPSG